MIFRICFIWFIGFLVGLFVLWVVVVVCGVVLGVVGDGFWMLGGCFYLGVVGDVDEFFGGGGVGVIIDVFVGYVGVGEDGEELGVVIGCGDGCFVVVGVVFLVVV